MDLSPSEKHCIVHSALCTTKTQPTTNFLFRGSDSLRLFRERDFTINLSDFHNLLHLALARGQLVNARQELAKADQQESARGQIDHLVRLNLLPGKDAVILVNLLQFRNLKSMVRGYVPIRTSGFLEERRRTLSG